MKKEKIIKTHTRRTKSGKTVTVRQHKAKYDAAEEAKQLAKKIGAGKELEKRKEGLSKRDLEQIELTQEELDEFAKGLGVSDKDVASWYSGSNWSKTSNAGIQRTDKAVRKLVGEEVYKEFEGTPTMTELVLDKIKAIEKEGKKPQKKFSKGIPYDVLDSAPDSSVAGKKVDSKVKVKDPFTKTATKPKGHSSFDNKFSVSPEDYKAWYHWDAEKDPKNKMALAVEKKLRAKMGRSEYNKYFDEMTNSYSSRGHLKAYKALEPETAKAIKSNKMVAGTAEAQKEVAKLQGAKKAEKIFAAKEKEAKGNLNKLSGKGTESENYPKKSPKRRTTPNDNVSKPVKFKAKEGFNYEMSDGSILTYIGGKKGEHKFKDFKTGKTKFKDSDTIYALSEQKKRYGRIK